MLQEIKNQFKAEFDRLVRENQFKIEFKDDVYSYDGYMKCQIKIEDFTFNCSINKAGFICWHDYRELLSSDDETAKIIIKAVKEYNNTNEKEILLKEKERIEERLKEIA